MTADNGMDAEMSSLDRRAGELHRLAERLRSEAWDENPRAGGGIKFDSGKPKAALLADFSRALQAVAEVGTFGAEKYSRGGWLSVPAGLTRYRDALWRHLLAEGAGEQRDAESGLEHLAHAAWNALAVLELHLRDIQKHLDHGGNDV